MFHFFARRLLWLSVNLALLGAEWCKDESMCLLWSNTGGCDEDDIREKCPMACRMCSCSDLLIECQTWKANGYCKGQWEDFMTRNCALSCNECTDKDVSACCSEFVLTGSDAQVSSNGMYHPINQLHDRRLVYESYDRDSRLAFYEGQGWWMRSSGGVWSMYSSSTAVCPEDALSWNHLTVTGYAPFKAFAQCYDGETGDFTQTQNEGCSEGDFCCDEGCTYCGPKVYCEEHSPFKSSAAECGTWCKWHYAPSYTPLEHRFSKDIFDWKKRLTKPSDWPLSPEDLKAIQKLDAVSVIGPDNCNFCDTYSLPSGNTDQTISTEGLTAVMGLLGGGPTHPTTNPDGTYWKELCEVVDVQIARRGGVPASYLMPLPRVWADRDITLAGVAEAVHKEVPGIYHISMINRFIADSGDVDSIFDKNIIPGVGETNVARHLDKIVHLVGRTYAIVGELSFALKWHEGRIRPEETVYLINNGVLTAEHGVPQDLIEKIKSMKIDPIEDPEAYSFTAYREGGPGHPAWPAMHSVGSVGSTWIPLILNLNEEQTCETRRMDWGISYGRLVAGVHYEEDNVAGLVLGQMIMRMWLPKYISDAYGSSETVVREKMDKLLEVHDWRKFRTSECFTSSNGKYPGAGCRDLNSLCPEYAAQGQCEKPVSADYMREHCPLSCGLCKEAEDRRRRLMADHTQLDPADVRKEYRLENEAAHYDLARKRLEARIERTKELLAHHDAIDAGYKMKLNDAETASYHRRRLQASVAPGGGSGGPGQSTPPPVDEAQPIPPVVVPVVQEERQLCIWRDLEYKD